MLCYLSMLMMSCNPKPNTPSDPEHTNMCYHTRTRTILSHVFYMAISIVERTEFLMEFMIFRYHKNKKGNIHLPDVSNKQCYLTFFSLVILSCACVS